MNLKFKDHEPYVYGLYQWPTYAGLLEGLPTDKMNARTLNYITSKAKELCYLKNYYLIEPEQKRIAKDIKDYPFGIPMMLPNIVCIAKLYLNDRANPAMHAEMILIWLQEKFCFPVDENITKVIATLDWKEHSMTFRT